MCLHGEKEANKRNDEDKKDLSQDFLKKTLSERFLQTLMKPLVFEYV